MRPFRSRAMARRRMSFTLIRTVPSTGTGCGTTSPKAPRRGPHLPCGRSSKLFARAAAGQSL
jgi:hypothetical protein